MPDYVAQWDSVWNPYVLYAAHQTDLEAGKVIDHIKEVKLPSELVDVHNARVRVPPLPVGPYWLQGMLRGIGEIFYTEIDKYTAKCRQLKNAPTTQLTSEVENLEYNLGLGAPDILRQLSPIALRLCAEVTKQMQKDEKDGFVKQPEHKNKFTDIALKLIQIERGLKADFDSYVNKDPYAALRTLGKIRQNP
jgi:hypothetical protein